MKTKRKQDRHKRKQKGNLEKNQAEIGEESILLASLKLTKVASKTRKQSSRRKKLLEIKVSLNVRSQSTATTGLAKTMRLRLKKLYLKGSL